MHVLHAISGIDPRNGGPTNALIGLAAAQVRAGLNVGVIATFQEDDAFRSVDRLESLGVGVRMVGPATGKLSRHPALTSNLVAEIAHADVVHVHAMWEEIQHQACRAAQRLRKPYVITPHGMLDPWNMSKGRLKKKLYLAMRMRANLEQASLLHYTTHIERKWVQRLKLSPPTIVEPLGLDVSEFANTPPKGTFREKYPQLGTRPIVLFLGRIHRGKGVEMLIPALAAMRRSDAMLVIAGPDSDGYKRKIDKLIEQHRVGDRVLFTGMIGGEDRLAALADADLFSLPSFHENFGLAVIEALAVGTPVIVSDQVSLFPDVMRVGVGSVVPLDPIALARELDRWLDDDSLRRAAAGRAPSFVRERFDWGNIAERWVGHYADVVACGTRLLAGLAR